MTADEFRTAMRVLDEGRPSHTIYDVEDAAAKIRPIKDAYWRMQLTTWVVGITLVAAAPLFRLPLWVGWLLAAGIVSGLSSVPAFRALFIRIPGLSSVQLARVASK